MQRCTVEGVSNADDAIEKPRGRSLGISSSSRSGGTYFDESREGQNRRFHHAEGFADSLTLCALLANPATPARMLLWSGQLAEAQALGFRGGRSELHAWLGSKHQGTPRSPDSSPGGQAMFMGNGGKFQRKHLQGMDECSRARLSKKETRQGNHTRTINFAGLDLRETAEDSAGHPNNPRVSFFQRTELLDDTPLLLGAFRPPPVGGISQTRSTVSVAIHASRDTGPPHTPKEK